MHYETVVNRYNYLTTVSLHARERILRGKQKNQRNMTYHEIILTIDYEQISSIVAKKVVEKLNSQCLLQHQPSPKRISGIRELAKHLGCSVSKGQDLKNKEIIPFYTIGKRVFFDPDKIDEAIKERKDTGHG